MLQPYIPMDLEQLRREKGPIELIPFPHQQDAFEQLRGTYQYPSSEYKGGLLVLPTGAGKTFAAIYWLAHEILPEGAKIIWLAHSFILLDQAYADLIGNAFEIQPPRRFMNVRVVSSNPTHCKQDTILPSDDVLIITTQTAITNFETDILNRAGQKTETPFRQYIEENKDKLFIVLDEAHHAPAYGCRSLLQGIRSIAPKVNILGLTATPTFNDKRRSGWLWELFPSKVLYEADRESLTMQGILARPKYIPCSTGQEYEVDDQLYNRLVKEHKDIPEDIIEKLAEDQPRNNMIIREYVDNADKYGKTIIFADRWFQCDYLREGLKKAGITVEAIYSKVDGSPGSTKARNEARQKRTPADNDRILREFRDNKYQVLINVRMLTEGINVPDVKTVFLTRQTTSPILMNQMIGRALRGPKAGGGPDKTEANIVMFMDDWKRYINWASPEDGGIDDTKPVYATHPVELISIELVRSVIRKMDFGSAYFDRPYLEYIPIGWYQTEIAYNVSDDDREEITSYIDYALVYNYNRKDYESFIETMRNNIKPEWASEVIDEESIKQSILTLGVGTENWLNDELDPEIANKLVKIVRHIAQNQTDPQFFSFDERKNYDLDKVAAYCLERRLDDIDQFDHLQRLFSDTTKLWRNFYRNISHFKSAFDASKNRLIFLKKGVISTDAGILESGSKWEETAVAIREPSAEEKQQVFNRDGKRCLACGRESGKGVKLQADHILAVSMKGQTTIDNLQTLCVACNRLKGRSEVDFRPVRATPLSAPKELQLFQPAGSEPPECSLARIVNFFYHCKAVSGIQMHRRKSGAFYDVWKINLYPGNNPEWLSRHEPQLMEYIHKHLKASHVKRLIVNGYSDQ